MEKLYWFSMRRTMLTLIELIMVLKCNRGIHILLRIRELCFQSLSRGLQAQQYISIKEQRHCGEKNEAAVNHTNTWPCIAIAFLFFLIVGLFFLLYLISLWTLYIGLHSPRRGQCRPLVGNPARQWWGIKPRSRLIAAHYCPSLHRKEWVFYQSIKNA